MKLLHIKNLETYHPSYKDRTLIWCKVYFSMINADEKFEMLEEVDKWRFVCFVMLELQLKKPVLLEEKYLIRKGFDFKNRKLKDTLKNLGDLIELIGDEDVTEDKKVSDKSVTQKRVEEKREDKKRYGELNNVLLTLEEKQKLDEKFSRYGSQEFIDKLSFYIASTNKKYNSHYATILSWDRKNKKDQKENKAFIEPKQKEIF